MLTDFFIASSEDAASIASGDARAPDYRTQNADNSVLAGLWTALDETSDSSRLSGEDFLVAMGSAEGPWVFELPDEMTKRLSELPETEFPQISSRWAGCEELSYYNVTAQDMLPSLTVLKKLAGQACASDRKLLLRMAM